MKYAGLFLWVLVPFGLWLAVSIWGTPHLVTSYRFHDNGARWNPQVHRVYIDCTYWGALGTVTVLAEQGRCPWIRFFKAEGT